MTDHQLSYCNVCTRKHFDPQRGIVCSLTGEKPDFSDTCPTFDQVPGTDRTSVAAFLAPRSAALGKRFANLVIDAIFYYLLVFILAFLIGIVFAFVAPELLDEMAGDETPLWSYVFAYIVYYLYYSAMEIGFGRTIGKMITGTKVVDQKGNRPSTEAVLKRSLARIVPFEGFSFLGSEPRGWHDRWTDTYVVDKSRPT